MENVFIAISINFLLHQLREKHAENIFQIRINIRPTFVYNFVDIYHSHMYNSNIRQRNTT